MILNDVLMHLHNARKVLIAVGTLARASFAVLVLLLHVRSQVGGLSKSARFVNDNLSNFIIGQVKRAFLNRPISAESTREWFFPSVYNYVMEERLSRGELLIADRANKKLLSSVEPTMLGQVPFPLETFAAIIALKCGCLSSLHLNLTVEKFGIDRKEWKIISQLPVCSE